MQEKPKLIEAVKLEYQENFKIRKSTTYDELYQALAAKYKECRSKGHRIDHSWLCSNATKIFQEQQKNSSTQLRSHVISNFISKYNLRIRRNQGFIEIPDDSVLQQLQDWHSMLRERLVRTGSSEDYDSKWGRFPPQCRFNVDQVPCPFLSDTNLAHHRLAETKTQRKSEASLSSNNDMLNKRQCVLQICCSPEGPQPRLGIVFCDPGKAITEDEIASWHPDVDVYFQENAWVDSKVAVEWVEKTLKQATSHLNRFVLFADNLTGQVGSEFKQAVKNNSGVVWYGPPNASGLWQPIESGYGKMLQQLMEQELHKWLDDVEHVQRWYGNENSYSAKERRILIIHWAGEAYRRLIREEYDRFRRKIWFKTGCLITADGSDDEKIKPNGLTGYKPPAPCRFLEPSLELPSSNKVDSVEYPPAEDVPETKKKELRESIGSEQIDKEEDRIEDELVNRRILALYNTGCIYGKIMYYNKNLNEYFVKFDDSTDDYFTLEEINGVEVQLL